MVLHAVNDLQSIKHISRHAEVIKVLVQTGADVKSYSVENCAHASNCGQGGELCPSKSVAGRLLTSPNDENKVVRSAVREYHVGAFVCHLTMYNHTYNTKEVRRMCAFVRHSCTCTCN